MEERNLEGIFAAKLQGLVKGVELTDKEKALLARVLKAIEVEEKKVEDTDPDG